MTHRRPSRFTLLLFVALSALAGCDLPSTPKPGQNTPSDVQFNVVVPPETALDSRIFIKGSDPALNGLEGNGLELTYQGSDVYSAKARLPRQQDIAYTLRMLRGNGPMQVALDLAGNKVPERTFQVNNPEQVVDFMVDRWGPEAGAGAAPQTVFIVAVPENTPNDAHVWLSGNQESLGTWNGAGVELYKAVNNGYATTLSFPVNTPLEFKATRGSWETVEKSEKGEEVANHTFKTGGGFERVNVTVAAWADLIQNVPPSQVLTGNIKYLNKVMPKDTTLKPRDVIVWLPPGYDDANNTARYPVLYMHDGQNLMDASTAFAGEWGVDETAQKLVTEGRVEPLIIVGIYNTSDRIPEYTQVADPKYPGGRADVYGRFLVEELKPLIDSTYRTKPEAQYTGLAGSSLGGLVSMYLGMKYPGTFTRLGVVSPSVWWANKDIVSKVNALSGKLPLRIWEDIGTEEGSSTQEGTENVDDSRLLRDALVGKGWVLDSDLKYTEVQGGKHNEASWAARFGDILLYLYPKQ